MGLLIGLADALTWLVGAQLRDLPHPDVGELLDDLPFAASTSGPIFWGGPCEPTRMQVLHRLRRQLPREVEVCQGLNLGIDSDTFRKILSEALLPGESLHAYVGHAGWGSGQLPAELETGSWITCTADAAIVFEADPEEMWERVLKSLGPEFARLTRVPIDPRLN